MARLQDFQPVTPTDSDNLLIVQATGQGLASVGSTLGTKLDKENPTGIGSLSLNKASGSSLGTNAVAMGTDNTASGNHSIALGQLNVASNQRAVALGQSNTVSGEAACALGYANTVSGDYSCVEGRQNIVTGKDGAHADGNHNKASYRAQHVFGEYNIEDVKAGAGVGDRGNYVEIVGKGTSDSSRSNARTLDWSGNEVLAGGLKINGSQDVMPSISQTTGQFNGLVQDGQMWAILGQIASGDAAFLFVGHRVGSQVYRKFLFADSGFTYATNAQGTVAIMYNSSVSNIQATAIRLI